MAKHHWSIVPETRSGWWSVGLIIAMPLLFVVGSSFTDTLYASVPSGETILADIAARPALALTMLAGMLCGVSACVAGLLAILKQKERAILATISTVIGALFTLYLIAEVAFPH